MRQLFSVGEEVILCSKTCPEYNGEYTVYRVLKTGDFVKCRLTGDCYEVGELLHGFSYLLNQPHADNPEGLEINWAQRALRKKYKPSTESYSEMMRNLNTIKV